MDRLAVGTRQGLLDQLQGDQAKHCAEPGCVEPHNDRPKTQFGKASVKRAAEGEERRDKYDTNDHVIALET